VSGTLIHSRRLAALHDEARSAHRRGGVCRFRFAALWLVSGSFVGALDRPLGGKTRSASARPPAIWEGNAMGTRDEYVEEAKKRLDAWNTQISDAEAKMAAASEEAKARYAEQLADLQRHWSEAEAKMKEAAQSSAESWQKNHETLESAWKDVAEGFGRAWSRFS
jgi:gas vesicle protein